MAHNKTFVRVRYSETDKMGFVHHTHHLSWFEVGRTELLRELGCTYRDLEGQGIFMPVVEVGCRYRSPARYDDLLEIETELKEITYIRIRFEYQVKRVGDGKQIATGFTMHVCTDEMGTPQKLPANINEMLLKNTER
ncbi:MAG: thioesterase family protein [Acidobacteriota bacterium]